jgi:hypothetical protein
MQNNYKTLLKYANFNTVLSKQKLLVIKKNSLIIDQNYTCNNYSNKYKRLFMIKSYRQK